MPRKKQKKDVVLEKSPEAPTAPREQGVIHAEDGTSLFYEIRGEGKPLILNYGLTCRRRHWRHQIEHFSRNYSVITWDYRGHHGSTLPKNDRHLTLEWVARDLHSLIHALRLEKVVAFGHSMGVPVITEALRLDPKPIHAAVFVCGAVSNPFSHMFHTDLLDKYWKWYSAAYEWAPDWLNAGWQRFTRKTGWGYFLTSRLGFNPSTAQSEDVWSYMEGVAATPLLVFLSLLTDYSKYDGAETLKKVRTPILLIAGEKDFITPFKVEQEMAAYLQNGELKGIPLGSHNAHGDFPDLVNGYIDDFLKRVKYR